ncbi:nitrilase-related carbon-nitrogen hydrolase [Anaerotignum propionicum]|uniref:2-oxoglutaramate amidase n=1 Tax=Anaerotignum propionicum DSM 1682 TaxID=991789 RepID=A0A120MKF3_ANAPI|nr:nitrilase-related carbon-nitrogen hydrolase [Anaerotignum propionicum]AMJ42113.1 2-oxoglutaramate amidase [Anaerotignum propionicum DSM 1682]SHE51692.1 Carbon-nitrogen hydrolase [[Clostridium] propionicum DSM 1682] [Anaerotignum propionicum DSM 1682]
MRIGLAQIDMGFEHKQYARTLCQEMILTGAKENVDFMVFPEMTLTGFTVNIKELGEAFETSETIQFFKQQAILHHMAICFGLPIVDSQKAENQCVILSATGELLANYAKIHPFSFGTEKEFYIGGTTLAFCQIKDFTLSPFICYDLRFPEIFQIASKQSTLLVVIANWPVSRKEDWSILLKARAIENQAFVVGVNRAGTGGGLAYFGDSMVISPRGKILAQAKDGTNLTTFDISCEEALQCRNKFPLKSDRRPELYQQLMINVNGERSSI